jgi:hypothetical protein
MLLLLGFNQKLYSGGRGGGVLHIFKLTDIAQFL